MRQLEEIRYPIEHYDDCLALATPKLHCHSLRSVDRHINVKGYIETLIFDEIVIPIKRQPHIILERVLKIRRACERYPSLFHFLSPQQEWQHQIALLAYAIIIALFGKIVVVKDRMFIIF